jgi:hypothetical protein
MGNHGNAQGHQQGTEQAGHGFWLMVASCLPMILIFALIALRVI